MNYNKQQLEDRYMIIRSAVASQRLEGLTPDPQVVEDLYREARGEITLKEVHAKFLARVTSGNI